MHGTVLRTPLFCRAVTVSVCMFAHSPCVDIARKQGIAVRTHQCNKWIAQTIARMPKLLRPLAVFSSQGASSNVFPFAVIPVHLLPFALLGLKVKFKPYPHCGTILHSDDSQLWW